MASGQINLLDLFSQVSGTMQKNQKKLNEADSYNHDHGDHMVQIFEVITQAMKEKKNADPADQLEYAADLLRKESQSGSGKLYAEGFKKAAETVTGKKLDAGSILTILQTVMGSSGASKSSSGGDLLGSLLGQATGGSGSGGNLLGNLLGGLSGATDGGGDGDAGLDMGDLLSAGMDFMASKQSGKSGMEALTGALLKGAVMTESPHRAQSSELVTNTLLEALSGMIAK